ncbi:MAG: acyltransferase [Uliginosibacterium sp.]|nr:acyltransferase [Uliginosibacterium sp.]
MDALRGIAALSVFIYHIGAMTNLLAWAPLIQRLSSVGMFGVDLFFVLSGYFICSSIVRPLDWSAAKFASRRVRRIAPAYYCSIFVVVLSATIVSGWAGWMPLVDVFVHGLFLHNLFPEFIVGINGAYWTLGVEAGFYLVAMLCAPWLRNKERCLWVFSAWCGCAVLWRLGVYILAPTDAWTRFFFATQLPGCMDGFAVGGLVAYGERYWANWKWFRSIALFRAGYYSSVFFMALFYLVFGYLWFFGEEYWFRFGSAVVWRLVLYASFGGLLIYFMKLNESDGVGALLSASGLPALGKVSFSFYLHHIPMIRFVSWAWRIAGMGSEWGGLILVMFVLSYCVAKLSYSYVEAPFISRKSAES